MTKNPVFVTSITTAPVIKIKTTTSGPKISRRSQIRDRERTHRLRLLPRLDHLPAIVLSSLSEHTLRQAQQFKPTQKNPLRSLPQCPLSHPELVESVKQDLLFVKERDPACLSHVHCFLHFKGFLACQAHRIAHELWTQNRKVLALLVRNRVSESFGVDFHPGAEIGDGVLLDHATGVVIGETAVVGDNVSILRNVSLGGTGKEGDRHPMIGDGAKIGDGSVVLKDVPPCTMAVGNPARLLGGNDNPRKHDKVPGLSMDQTSHLSEWSDYVI